MRNRVAVDVGGTFTDLVTVDEKLQLKIAKSPTTPENHADGVRTALVLLRMSKILELKSGCLRVNILRMTRQLLPMLSSKARFVRWIFRDERPP